MKRSILYIIISAFCYVANAQTEIFRTYSSGVIGLKSAYIKSTSTPSTPFTRSQVGSDIVINGRNYSTTVIKGYKEVTGQIGTIQSYTFPYTNDVFYPQVVLTVDGVQKAVLVNQAESGIMVHSGSSLRPEGFQTFGVTSLDGLKQKFLHGDGISVVDGKFRYTNSYGYSVDIVTLDAVTETKTSNQYKFMAYKYTGNAWDNENEDFNEYRLYNTLTSSLIGTYRGVFKKFNNIYGTLGNNQPFYQVNMSKSTALIITGKEKSNPSAYLNIVILKNGKSYLVYNQKQSLLSIEEDSDTFTAYVSQIKNRTRNVSKIVFNKSTDKVTIEENIEELWTNME